MARSQNGIVKRLLMSKLHELTGLSKRDGIAIDRAPDELDEVQQANDRELVLAAIERDAVLANQVRIALKRLEEGEYGVCLLCEKEIGSRRLRAVPWTSMCVTCQGHVEADQEGTSRGSSAMPTDSLLGE
jgi:DnaK suppressor protein